MSARAGIVVTGTEVLSGRVSDRNGPWLAEQLLALGVELAHVTIVGDRPGDVRSALDHMAAEQLDLVVTSGGLGPTADDLTAEVVGGFQGREMVLDEALSGRIAEIVAPLLKRWPNIDPEAIEAANRKQATVPAGAEILEPVGTAPGLVVAPASGTGPTVVVLPGPPRELQPMWGDALQTQGLRAVLAAATVYEQATMRLFGIPESEIAETLRVAEADGIELGLLEVTTCLKRGEIEIVTRYEPEHAGVYEAFAGLIGERHADTLYSSDGATVDDQVACLLLGDAGEPVLRTGSTLTVATAESCTGGLLAARLTDKSGSSRYVRGAIVAYDNEVKSARAAVPAELIERHGAVSQEVAEALAASARSELGADVGVGITGVAGPDGGTPEKPVGLVWLSVAHGGDGPVPDGQGGSAGSVPGGPGSPDGQIQFLTRSVNLPGGRADVRERAASVAMHLLRRSLLGETAPPLPGSPPAGRTGAPPR